MESFLSLNLVSNSRKQKSVIATHVRRRSMQQLQLSLASAGHAGKCSWRETKLGGSDSTRHVTLGGHPDSPPGKGF